MDVEFDDATSGQGDPPTDTFKNVVAASPVAVKLRIEPPGVGKPPTGPTIAATAGDTSKKN